MCVCVCVWKGIGQCVCEGGLGSVCMGVWKLVGECVGGVGGCVCGGSVCVFH